MEQDVAAAIVRLSGQEVFDIVYMDPPYAKDYERGALEALAAGSIIDGYTTIIIEEKRIRICRMCRIWAIPLQRQKCIRRINMYS